ncbi:MAG: hypothetical protein QF752_11355 [Planctomycetota bacterium]|nr:hypothetical protein [Planctomycetota bacterium]
MWARLASIDRARAVVKPGNDLLPVDLYGTMISEMDGENFRGRGCGLVMTGIVLVVILMLWLPLFLCPRCRGAGWIEESRVESYPVPGSRPGTFGTRERSVIRRPDCPRCRGDLRVDLMRYFETVEEATSTP